jgi:hypothetical protein
MLQPVDGPPFLAIAVVYFLTKHNEIDPTIPISKIKDMKNV